jgi:hypothetical protein
MSKHIRLYVLDDFWSSLTNAGYTMMEFMTFYFKVLVKGRFKIKDHVETRFGNRHMTINFLDYVILCGTYLERVPVYNTTDSESNVSLSGSNYKIKLTCNFRILQDTSIEQC